MIRTHGRLPVIPGLVALALLSCASRPPSPSWPPPSVSISLRPPDCTPSQTRITISFRITQMQGNWHFVAGDASAVTAYLASAVRLKLPPCPGLPTEHWHTLSESELRLLDDAAHSNFPDNEWPLTITLPGTTYQLTSVHATTTLILEKTNETVDITQNATWNG